MMLKVVVLSLVLMVSLVLASKRINFIQKGKLISIKTNGNNYALYGPLLPRNNWATVSINNGKVTYINTKDCQLLEKTTDSLQYYDKNVLRKINGQLTTVPGSMGISAGDKFENSLYKLEAGSAKVHMVQGPSSTYSHYTDENSGVSLSKNDDNNFSLTRYDMQDNLVRVFFSNDIITFVYSNGEVHMKPIKCLDSDETLLAEAFRAEAKQLEEDGKKKMLMSNEIDGSDYDESDTLVIDDNSSSNSGSDDSSQQQDVYDDESRSNNLPIVGPSKNRGEIPQVEKQ